MSPHPPGKRLLLPTDQIARKPLRAWSRDLASRLARGGAEAESAGGVVAACANNAALILAHAGDTGAARALCMQHIAWGQERAAAGDAEALTWTVQPWVNLGRLGTLAQGDVDEALERFAAPLAFARRRPGPSAPPLHTAVHRMLERDGAKALDLFALVYVVDSTRALLSSGRYEDVLAFRLPPDASGSGARHRLAEARIVALTYLSRHGEAEAEARACISETASWSKLVFYLRWAEILASSGRLADAGAVAAPLTSLCLRLSPTIGALPPSEVSPLLVLARIAQVAADLGCERRDVEGLRQATLRAAVRAEDLVLEWELVRLGLQVALPPERDRCASRLDEIASATAYARLRPSDRCRPLPEEIGRVCRLLASSMSTPALRAADRRPAAPDLAASA